jgi:hypothetical protein
MGIFDHFNDDVRQEVAVPKRRRRKSKLRLVETREQTAARDLAQREFENDVLRRENAARRRDDDMTGQFTDAATALRYMRAGNATVTLRSLKTSVRFTYRLRESDDKQCLFVGALTGPDNETSYSYLGRISRDIFWAGRKVPRPGDVGADAPTSRAFAWSWRQLVSGRMPDQLEVWHEGRCGRCGRKLTVPESVAAGFGPECAGRLA